MRVKTTLIAAALAGVGMLSMPGFAAADVIRVSPGESIQAAIDQAAPGDTVKVARGTFEENVQIKTPGVTLKGADEDETFIVPGATPSPVDPICEGTGVCVSEVPDFGPPTPPTLADVRVKDLAVRGFVFSGVFFYGTVDHRVSDVFADGSEYGIFGLNTTGGKYLDNTTPDNIEAGIYIGDSENADSVVRDNVANGNQEFGIFLRDAANGVVEDNETSGNCMGILILDTPGPPVAGDWVLHDNDASHNTGVCAFDAPTAGGIGIGIAGAQNNTLVGNRTNGNVPASAVDLSGGIVLVTIPGPTPEETNLATGNTVKFNKAFGNSPVDILWDEQGENSFIHNRCETSSPDGLCTGRGHGHGHGRGDDDDDDDDDDGHGHHGDRHDGDHGKSGGWGRGDRHDDD
jgi:parallel beta-helix repeat protein